MLEWMEAALGQSSAEVDREQSFLKTSSDGGLAVENSRDGILLVLLSEVGTIPSFTLAGAISYYVIVQDRLDCF